jgi:hypothetical protein
MDVDIVALLILVLLRVTILTVPWVLVVDAFSDSASCR